MTNKIQPLIPGNTDGLEEIARQLLEEVPDGNAGTGMSSGTHSYHQDMIYIPTVKLWFTDDILFRGKNWNDCHKELANLTRTFPSGYKSKLRMPTPMETWGLILYAKEHLDDSKLKRIYEDILKKKPKDIWRGEWQNAKFVQGSGFNNLNLETVVDVDSNGNLKTNSLVLQPCLGNNTYAKLKTNSQGFLTEPSQDAEYKQGENLYFWTPVKNAVARFVAYSVWALLVCDWNPSYSDSSLGVRGCVSAEGALPKI
jgi:hypothetical protein